MKAYEKVALENIIPYVDDVIENAFCVDRKGNVLFYKKGTRDEVSFSLMEMERMKGEFLIHNHPDFPHCFPRCLSDGDISFAKRKGLLGISSVTRHEGYIEYARAIFADTEPKDINVFPTELSSLRSELESFFNCGMLESVFTSQFKYHKRLAELYNFSYEYFRVNGLRLRKVSINTEITNIFEQTVR